MSIVNRTKDLSEQKSVLSFQNFSLALTTGETGVLSHVPYPCTLNAAQLAAFSVVTGANLLLTVNRFIPGAGFTAFALGSTFLPASYGTSGVLANGISLPASGSAELKLMANDVLGYVVGGGASTGIFGMAGSFVVTPSQDIKTYFGALA